MGYVIEFRDATPASIFSLAPETAIEWFKGKGLKPTFDYRDMVRQEHDVAFTVAKMMDVDLLRTTQELLDKGMAEGWSKERFTQELAPRLKRAGWWGTQNLTDPITGMTAPADLGSAHRLKNIWRSNLQSSYSVGQWERIQEQAEAAPYLLYDAVDDQRTRPEHAAWDNVVLAVDDPFWRTHMPPNGYQCRCGVIQVSKDELEALGLSPSKPPRMRMRDWTNPRTGRVERVPEGIDPGWAHNPGQARIEALQALLREKVQTLPLPAQQAFDKGVKAYQTNQAVQAAQKALAKEQGASNLQRAKAATLQRAAQWQIDNAIETKAPYLATAIKAVKATKEGPDLTPAELLAKATEKAQAAEKSAQLSAYKSAVVKGKTPPAKAQAVFNTLDPDDQAALGEQIAALQAKKAAEEALAGLEETGGGGVYAKALAKLKASGEADKLNAVQLWQAVIKEGDAAKAKIVQGVNLSNYKKAVIQGKTPKEGQLAAYKALTPDEQADLDDELAKAIAAKEAKIKADQEAKEAALAADLPEADLPPADTLETPTAGPVIHPEALTRIGPQKGSNPGGLFVDEETGIKWYVKKPQSEEIARNEVLAGKLYQAAGIEAPDMELITFEGGPAIASRIIDGLESGSGEILAKTPGARDGFVVDAWLGNWDVVGLGYDNLLIKAGRAVRVDTGGALRYRAQGGPKGAAWGNTVGELETLRNPGTNPQAAQVFGQVTQEELLAGARRVLALDADQIRRLVDDFGPLDPRDRDTLVKTLLARQDDIGERFPEARKTPDAAPPPPDVGQRVTRSEAEAIDFSRGNGYAIPTDKDMIEDQEALFWNEIDVKGQPVTSAEFKLRGKGMEIMRKLLNTAPSDDPAESLLRTIKSEKARLDEMMLMAMKGMKANEMGEGLRDKDIERAQAALDQYGRVFDSIEEEVSNGTLAPQSMDDFREHYMQWAQTMLGVTSTPRGAKGYLGETGLFEPGPEPKLKPRPQVDAPSERVAFERRVGQVFRRKQLERGYMKQTEGAVSLDTQVHQAEIDGVTISYWSDDQDFFAMTGRMRIDVPGNDPADAAKVYATLERLGINAERPSKLDQEELYLQQSAYALNRGWRQLEDDLTATDSQEERVALLKSYLSEEIGTNVEELPTYRPQGQREAFGTGHVRRYRPQYQGKEWEDFKKNHRIIHKNTGGMPMPDLVDIILNSGGKMITTTDKLRRGIPLGGMSPIPDLESGGANYFFTRIYSKRQADSHVGFVWKADQAARVDAISYQRDLYGETKGDTVVRNRKGTIEGLKENAKNSGNETNFKNGLSLFDQLEVLRVDNERERRQVIEVFRRHGYDQWPDGRALEDVIVSAR